MTEETKQMLDVTAGGVTLGAFFSWLPEATALASLVWVLLRIYETDTVQKLLGKSEE